MAYDGSSFFGDLIVDEYDDKNNLVGSITPSGFYIYHILGDSFDKMSEECENFLNNISLLSADAKSLDNFWGVSYNMPRPKLNAGTPAERNLNDAEYRAYLYLRNCRLMTREDIEINMNKVFAVDGFEVYFSEETNYLNATDHKSYTASVTDTSNLAKNNDDDTNDYVVQLGSEDDDVNTLEGNLSIVGEVVQVVNIPFQQWSSDFLEFLGQYISLKGDLQVKEYNL